MNRLTSPRAGRLVIFGGVVPPYPPHEVFFSDPLFPKEAEEYLENLDPGLPGPFLSGRSEIGENRGPWGFEKVRVSPDDVAQDGVIDGESGFPQALCLTKDAEGFKCSFGAEWS